MKIRKTEIENLLVIENISHNDRRGYFFELYNKKNFYQSGLQFDFIQDNVAFSKKKYTLRGLHFQSGKMAQSKFIKCLKGSILDVVVDLRKESSTYLHHFKIILSDENNLSLFVPKGFAHGYLTLKKNTTVIYKVDNHYDPSSEQILAYNDKKININWNCRKLNISSKDSMGKSIEEIERLL